MLSVFGMNTWKLRSKRQDSRCTDRDRAGPRPWSPHAPPNTSHRWPP
ncbi:hypothetical protein BN2537_16687 [Streptomyces venezuelae]|nr:hypothetical protein BN2537_16687 [Streptomyces venezuelae]